MKHKYIFYFYPRFGEKRGKFRMFERVKQGKLFAEMNKYEYDYQKLY